MIKILLSLNIYFSERHFNHCIPPLYHCMPERERERKIAEIILSCGCLDRRSVFLHFLPIYWCVAKANKQQNIYYLYTPPLNTQYKQ